MNRNILYNIVLLLLFCVCANSWGQLPREGELEAGEYTLNANHTLVGPLEVKNGTVIINLNGKTLTGPSKKFTFLCQSSATLTIRGTGKIQGRGNNGGGDRGGCILVRGTFNLEGGTITNFMSFDSNYDETNPVHIPTQGCGGAVFVDDGGTFNMSGGEITNCWTKIEGTTFGRGGGVFIDAQEKPGTFNMTGGTISGCYANFGGAVYIHKSLVEGYTDVKGIFNMSGGTLSGNGAHVDGCAVYANGDMTMSDPARIENNAPKQWTALEFHNVNDTYEGTKQPITKAGGCYGGGVYTVDGSVFTMNGGTISNNIAESGGGVMVWTNSTFNMHGGTITGNYAIGQGGLGNGGAVYVQEATFNFYNGTLSNNTAVRYGGAININQTATLNLNGNCIVEGNQAMHGGGISQEAGECIMTLGNAGIHLKNNIAHGFNSNEAEQQQGNGGGLFIEKGSITITAGTIEGNKAYGNGGGASMYLKRIEGDITAIIKGGLIKGNRSESRGGGIDLFADFAERTGKNNVQVTFENGRLEGNEAPFGGGIYVGINEDNSVASMEIGTSATTPEIIENTAEMSGGALGMSNGTITIENGAFRKNKATLGNGGAVYLGDGQLNVTGKATFENNTAQSGGGMYMGAGGFEVTGTTSISSNSAENGGGICILNGEVHIKEGTIQDNQANIKGGGLYVYNTGTEKNVIFQGGAFIANSAAIGGGACVIGDIKLTIDATFEGNTAKNGGALYMKDGVEMSFGTGLIRANTATNANNMVINTAHHATFNEETGKVERDGGTPIYGFGAGIFMDNNTSLTFTKPEEFGLYNNSAESGADDIFLNGNGTTVTLPVTKEMNLKGFNVPNELYWVEDYPTSSEDVVVTYYPNEDGPGPIRYDEALADGDRTLGILENKTNPKESLTLPNNYYACITLGYDLVFVDFIKSGLNKDDDATFIFSYKNNAGDYVDYTKVIITGDGGEEITKTVALPSGEWKIQESSWGWKYTPKYYDSREKTKEIDFETESITITRGGDKEYFIENTLDPRFSDIKEFEHRKRNLMRP